MNEPPMVERIESEGTELAIILRSGLRERGIQFFTPPDLSQQLACMRHPAGHLIAPHVHNPAPRSVQFTQEALFLRRGKLRVDFYSEAATYLESRVLEAGDVILLIRGGHGFEVLEEIEMVEVKQGPYVGDSDKTRIKAISSSDVRFSTKTRSER